MDKTKLTESYLNSINETELATYGIYKLRNEARDLGVPTPTKLKKDELISQIMDIKSGKQKPVERSNRGRPPFEEINRKKTVEPYSEDIGNFAATKAADTAFSAENYAEDGAKEGEQEKDVSVVGATERREGILDIMPEGGYGFLRAENCECGNRDTYISNKVIRALGLRRGDLVVAEARVNFENRPAAVISVESVNGAAPDNLYARPHFDKSVPIFPDQKLNLELPGTRGDMAIRMIDLIAPIGKGQRAMVVSPPKAGKTTLLKKIAHSITVNNPEVKLFVLLVDERPEEVTDMKRSINGEIVYSTFDETPEHHTKAAELVIERAKRLVELGNDVVIIMDSLTRLARAYNLTIPPTGRTLSGGIDPGALHSPKRFFGAARNIENGGSLTIIATALIDTGSRMDDVIYEEFKGTGNMEIHLDRKLSEKRIFPAIDLNRSGTRREDLLLTAREMEGIWAVRKMLGNGENSDSAEKLIEQMMKTKNNAEFIEQLMLHIKMLQDKGYKLRS